MSIFKRNGVYYASISTPSGGRIKQSLGTKDETEAQELHDKLKHDSWRVSRLGERQKRSFDEGALRWLEEMEHKKTIEDDKIFIAHFRKHLGTLTLDQITADHIREAVNKLSKNSQPVTGARKNRYLSWVRAMLRKAEREWLWIEKAPTIRLYAEAKRRIRWLTPQEAERLIAELPDHLKPVVTFALHTGLRRSNVVGLRWDQVDMQRQVAWIHGDEAKAGKAIGVPLNRTAIDAIRSQLGKNSEYVFTHKGQPMCVTSNTAWRSALKRAGISNFRFHDLRHTWASWHVQSGTSLVELQELGGWETMEMVRKYAHLAPEHLKNKAAKLDGMTGGNWAHVPNLSQSKKIG